MHAIKATKLVKRYGGLTAVDGLELEIRQGELFSLLGVNGAGKTTVIKMLTCLTKPSDGDAIVGGFSITREPERVKGLLGVSPQETAVAPNLSTGSPGRKPGRSSGSFPNNWSWRAFSTEEPESSPAAGSAGSASPWL